MVPSGIAFWNKDLTHEKYTKIVIERVFLLSPTNHKLKVFLNKIQELVFENQNHQIEIYYSLEHKKINNEFDKPQKELVQELKSIGWRWKMILNLEENRYTIFAIKNNKDRILNQFHFNLTQFNLLISQQSLIKL